MGKNQGVAWGSSRVPATTKKGKKALVERYRVIDYDSCLHNPSELYKLLQTKSLFQNNFTTITGQRKKRTTPTEIAKRCSRKKPNTYAEEWMGREEDPPGFAVKNFENKGKYIKYTSSVMR